MFTLFFANNILFVNCLLQPFRYILQNAVNDNLKTALGFVIVTKIKVNRGLKN
jgi:hypothetical protein